MKAYFFRISLRSLHQERHSDGRSLLGQVVQQIGQQSKAGGRMAGKVDIFNVKKYVLVQNILS